MTTQDTTAAARANARMAAIRANPALRYVGRPWADLEMEQQAEVRGYIRAQRLACEKRPDGLVYVIAGVAL